MELKNSFSLLLLLLVWPAFAFADDNLDVAVVGAGVSGAYSAFRLQDNKHSRNIALFEMSNRIGGRLFSYKFPNTNTYAELGGMRITNFQPLVYSLARDKLKLTLQDTSPKPQIRYVDSIRCFSNQSNINPQCQRINSFVFDKVVKKFSSCAPPKIKLDNLEEIDECLQNTKYKGRFLSDYSVSELLSQMLSKDEYTLLQTQIGYDSYFGVNLSAVYRLSDLIVRFYKASRYYTIKEGMQRIPLDLVDLFQKDGGKVYLETKVDSINWDGKVFILVTKNTQTGQSKTFHANKVIFAAGQYAVLNLKTNFLNDSSSQELLNSVAPIDLSKIWVTYSDFWWHSVNHIYWGISVTDLPVRQVLYFDPLFPDSPQHTDAVMKASYAGGKNAYYWKNYYDPYTIVVIDGQNKSADLKMNYANLDLKSSNYIMAKNLLAPLEVDLNHQLAEIHGVNVPLAKSTLVVDWSKPPFGAAVHIWKPTKNIPKTAHQIVNINPKVPFYIVGEAYAVDQGWVEGALETSEYMLEHYFGLQYPQWSNSLKTTP